ncbi:hypothetical protein Acr_03g0009780 [Actinidia rufa]|uniref:Late embryogenesis abundant protein LEA-2 subgroup domain-containing protein n=1 Tax=Actinidia rufa TaxID=165716 RepID=A0A7J0ECH0_9ERIC|nr:hypothetical protein Acr_03g0009780 [Actinidia rufa]
MADQRNDEFANTDIESVATAQHKDLRRKKGLNWAAAVALLIITQIVLFVAIDLIILKAKTPKFRLSSAAIDGLTVSNATATPSFSVSFNAVYAVKNPNFGPFEYLDTHITFSYRGKRVGEAKVTEARAKALSTKKVGFKVNVSSRSVSTDSNLGSDIDSGKLGLTVGSELRGQVEYI